MKKKKIILLSGVLLTLASVVLVGTHMIPNKRPEVTPPYDATVIVYEDDDETPIDDELLEKQEEEENIESSSLEQDSEFIIPSLNSEVTGTLNKVEKVPETQKILSDTGDTVEINLTDISSNNNKKVEKVKPDKPVSIGDNTNPDMPPIYDTSILSEESRIAQEEIIKRQKDNSNSKSNSSTSKNKETESNSLNSSDVANVSNNNTDTNSKQESTGKPGQVYDPAYGWITPSDSLQDNIDSDGDINKIIGTMG